MPIHDSTWKHLSFNLSSVLLLVSSNPLHVPILGSVSPPFEHDRSFLRGGSAREQSEENNDV